MTESSISITIKIKSKIMEFKKKTIIGEDNNEPPKNYIGVKSDGNAYEFNHTTRQGEKIMSSNGSNDGGGGSNGNSNTFFQLATIQPNRYVVFPPDGDTVTPIDIENLDLNTYINYLQNDKTVIFFYSKEELAKLGISLEELEALEYVTFDNMSPTENNSISIDGSIIRDNFIIQSLDLDTDGTGVTGIRVDKIYYESDSNYVIMRLAYGDNNNYIIKVIGPSVSPIVG